MRSKRVEDGGLVGVEDVKIIGIAEDEVDDEERRLGEGGEDSCRSGGVAGKGEGVESREGGGEDGKVGCGEFGAGVAESDAEMLERRCEPLDKPLVTRRQRSHLQHERSEYPDGSPFVREPPFVDFGRFPRC